MSKSLLLALGLFAGTLSTSQAQTIELVPAWESDTTLRTPESVLYEPGENVLYVACINGGPSLENKNSFIAKVGLDGKVFKLKFTENLNSTKGMGVLGKKLYVTEMTQVAEIDLASGKVLNIIYITDSGHGKVWSLSGGKVNLVMEGDPLKGTNGLLFENNQLLIGNGDGSLLSLNPATKKLTTIAKVSGGIDGIVALGNKSYIVTEWAGKIWHVKADGTTELKSDSSAEKINTADVGYNPKTKTLYVPTFFHNTVKAYTVK
jgi:hypothetical protein